MKLSNITFQKLTIYDQVTGKVIAETAQNPSMTKAAEICYLDGYICLQCPECKKMLGLRTEYHTGEMVECPRCKVKSYVKRYER